MLTFLSCKSNGNGEKKSSLKDSKHPVETFKAPSYEGKTGKVIGVVKLIGDIPEMPTLQMGSDPACAKVKTKAETVLADAQGFLANTVVRVKPGTAPTQTSKAPVLVDQVDCLYRPRVQMALSGQDIRVSNSDKTFHNVHASKLESGKRQATDTILNQAQPEGAGAIDVPSLGEDVVKLKCDTHGWMTGFVVVSDNIFGSVSGAHGAFELEAPVGELQIQAWHEYFGVQTFEVTVSENQSSKLEIEFEVATQ